MGEPDSSWDYHVIMWNTFSLSKNNLFSLFYIKYIIGTFQPEMKNPKMVVRCLFRSSGSNDTIYVGNGRTIISRTTIKGRHPGLYEENEIN